MKLHKLLTLLLISFPLLACKSKQADDTLKIGASPVPHAQILNHAKPLLAEKGVNIQVIEITDYVQPNIALLQGDIDANFFQHIPYLEQFNADHKADFRIAARVHVEPLGIYSKKLNNLQALKDKPQITIAIPNDPTNASRALELLQTAGLVPEGTTSLRSLPSNLKIRELESAQLPRVLPDVDAAVINTNYALPAGLNPTRDALLLEGTDSPYANVLVVRPESENDPRIQALQQTLNSPEVRTYIQTEFDGAIIPVF